MVRHPEHPATTPEIARRNRALGWAVVALIAGVMVVTYVIRFMVWHVLFAK